MSMLPAHFASVIPAILPRLLRRPLPRLAARAGRLLAAVFLVLAGWGVFVHVHGATSIAANQWSALPVNVDEARWRVWDWSDPQFLRGLR